MRASSRFLLCGAAALALGLPAAASAQTLIYSGQNTGQSTSRTQPIYPQVTTSTQSNGQTVYVSPTYGQQQTTTYPQAQPTVTYPQAQPTVTYPQAQPTVTYPTVQPTVTYPTVQPTVTYPAPSPRPAQAGSAIDAIFGVQPAQPVYNPPRPDANDRNRRDERHRPTAPIPWTRGDYNIGYDIGVCLEATNLPNPVVTMAYESRRDSSRVRLAGFNVGPDGRISPSTRQECVVNPRRGSRPEFRAIDPQEVLPGEFDPIYAPVGSRFVITATQTLQPVVDGGGALIGWLVFENGANVDRVDQQAARIVGARVFR